ncbi:hypothetical protein J2751_000114 [Halorubrum alkaliphilum]|uniref:Uncharacterized protein n=1 Tax=Halorubrum alkaliphilum TaxID=261290 RepID=A0A8T4GCC1_9EURY|nr:DUF5821 family protein [Halorubrum alkaliphilum]MBP1921131.1 hypothetical protein [Halorubrum alkaliphilum]
MPTGPSVQLADGSIPLAERSDPLLVDPDPPLLAAVIGTYRDAYPDIVDPDLDALRDAAAEETGPLTDTPDLPTLTVLAAEGVVDAVTDGFHASSRLAALTEPGTVDLLTLAEPQPNVVLAGEATGCVLVEDDGDDVDETPIDETRSRHRVGDDPSLRDRYVGVVDDAPANRLRTPSRHRIYDAFVERCGPMVADDVIRILDAAPDLSGDDVVGPRIRAYVVGARHGVLDHDLRRGCEDAGLGSPSTFTRVKRQLIDAGLVDTERVPQPVGRPRERIVAKPALAQPPLSTVAEPIRAAVKNR